MCSPWFPALCVWQRLRELDLDYIVSPYESDAQLAYLSREGLVDAVITEDSDLIPYGASRVRRGACACAHAPCTRPYCACVPFSMNDV